MNEERKFFVTCLSIIAVAVCITTATVAMRDVLIAQIKCEAVK